MDYNYHKCSKGGGDIHSPTFQEGGGGTASTFRIKAFFISHLPLSKLFLPYNNYVALY